MKIPAYPIWLLLLFSFLLVTACTESDPASVVGDWEAAELKEEGKVLDVALEEIRFSFKPDNTYEYNSTLNYREAGRYEIKSKYLYTTDTLNQASTEKVVEIVRLTPDTMVIRMEQDMKERLLTLAKSN